MTRRPAHTLNDKTLTVQVAWTDHDYLTGLSRRSGLPMSALLREIVKGFINKKAPQDTVKKLEGG